MLGGSVEVVPLEATGWDGRAKSLPLLLPWVEAFRRRDAFEFFCLSPELRKPNIVASWKGVRYVWGVATVDEAQQGARGARVTACECTAALSDVLAKKPHFEHEEAWPCMWF